MVPTVGGASRHSHYNPSQVCPQDSPSHQSLAEILFSGNMFVVKLNGGKKEATNLLESKEGHMEGFGRKREKRGNDIIIF